MKKIISLINYSLLCLFLMSCFTFISCSVSWAAPECAGIILQIKGDVFFISGSNQNTEQKARNFMKIKQNDVFDIAPGAQLQIVFFANGKKELWKGPSKIEIGEEQALAKDQSAAPAVEKMQGAVTKEIKRISKILNSDKLSTSGSILIRGNKDESLNHFPDNMILNEKEKEKVAELKLIYQQLNKSSEPEDITAELYLFSALADYDQFEDMKELLPQMQKKQPYNKEIKLLEDWLLQY